MMQDNVDRWENQIRQIAADMDYPPTPDIAAAVRQRLAAEKRPAVVRPWYSSRLAWVAAAVLLAAAFLIAAPQARAAIVNFLQIGDIRLFPDEPAITPAGEESSGIDPVTSPTAAVTATEAQAPELTMTPVPLFANLSGKTTLAELEAEFGEAFLLPSYPDGIGLPDEVFFQDQFGLLGIQVWLDTADPSKAQTVLYTLVLEEGAFGAKFHYHLDTMAETEVNGQIAHWVEGQHMLSFYDENGQEASELTRLVEGNTLIWTVDQVTYRLETNLTLEEAVRMAESMK